MGMGGSGFRMKRKTEEDAEMVYLRVPPGFSELEPESDDSSGSNKGKLDSEGFEMEEKEELEPLKNSPERNMA